MTLRSAVRAIIVLAVLVVACWFTLRAVDMQSVSASLNHISWPLVACIVPIILFSHYVRALRWVTILSPSVRVQGTWHALSAVLIGYASSVIIPRSGELVRPWIFSRRTHVPLGTAISSVVVERVLDVLTLLCGFGVVVLFQRDRVLQALPTLTPTTLLMSVVLPVFLLTLVIALLAFTSVGMLLAEFVRARIHNGVGIRLLRLMQNVREGTAAVRTPALWFRLLLQTLLMWFLYAVPLWLLFHAMPLAVFSQMGIVDAAFMLVVISVGVTIAPTPGALGVYQGFAQTALVQSYGATPAEGLAFGIVAWLVNYGVALISGGLCLVLEFQSGLSFKAFKDVRRDVNANHST